MNHTRDYKKNERPDLRKKPCPFSVLSACFLLLLFPMMGCSSNENPTSIPQGSGAQVKTQNIGGYKTANIGGVIWMAENLNIETIGSYCYNDVPDNCSKYGRLYTYEAAQTACPDGWHLATANEWDLLNQTVGTNSSASYYLKSMTGWWTDVGNGNDAYGFTALPGGTRNIDGVYSDLTLAGYFWAKAPADGYSVSYELHYNTSNLAKQTKIKIPDETAMSVRCVYDESKRRVSLCGQIGNTFDKIVYDTETQYCIEFGPSEQTIVDKKDVVIGGYVNCTIVYSNNTQESLTGNWCTVVTNGEEWFWHLCYVNPEAYDVDIKFPTLDPNRYSCTPAL